jgi:predicted small metal-binding protein
MDFNVNLGGGINHVNTFIKDMGASDCNFVATGQTAVEVKNKMWAHAAKDHKDKLASMSDQDKAKMQKMIDNLLAKQK